MYYYKRHIGDFRSGTINLSRLARWIYGDMLDVYYDTELPFPNDIQKICDLVGVEDLNEVELVKKIIRVKFELAEDGFFHHQRCDEEISEFHGKGDTARANGRLGGRPRRADYNQREPDWLPDGLPKGSDVGFNEEPSTNQEQTGSQTNHKPLTINHKPQTTNQEPLTENQTTEVQNQQQLQNHPETKKHVSGKKEKIEKKSDEGAKRAWVSYANAYWKRYGSAPVRNAKVNGQFSQLVKRLGAEEAEQVASFYLTHQHRFYVDKMHSVGLLLSDCEKLRTEWATKNQMTSTKATQMDKTQTNLDAWLPLIQEAEERERQEKENAK